MNEQDKAKVQQALWVVRELMNDGHTYEALERAESAITALRQLLEADQEPNQFAGAGKAIPPAQPEPVQEPKVAAYWAVTDMEGKHIKVDADTQRLEIYEEKCWARANVRSNTKAMLVYITATTPPTQGETE